ncbi:mono-functional DNA-alkylating methyl methanesulfonate N-term-domain-containing protein [Sporodiniella umbellata]|nr:mono-functional DNA-alkylating methyl methanesulfonate N-term-domain-containing protein [Sporodiniella umbellata]
MFVYNRSSSYNTVIKRILKGAIASSNSNDVVLVNENSLQWYKLHPLPETLLSIELQQSTFGTLFDARLLTCHFDDSVRSDHLQKQQIGTTRKHSPIQGRDVIVAISEYGKLVFIAINSLSENIKRFETLLEVYLDAPGLEYDKKGRIVAVDPCSRAIAVASVQDRIDVFLLNTNNRRDYFNPILGNISCFEKGIIWHMEFLYTETTSTERILLSLVVYDDEEKIFRVVLYSIDASNMENVTIERIGRLPMATDTPLPVLLIPLQFAPESFLLVTEQHANLLTSDDVVCGNVLYPNSPIPRSFGSIESPLFTSFSQHSEKTANYIYLGSSEGYLFRLTVLSTGVLHWSFLDTVNPIGTSMCVLGIADLVEEQDAVPTDILVYAGECANSQVISILHSSISDQSGHKTNLLQELVNRAPLRHTEVIPSFNGSHDSLIACSGVGKQGFLNTISRGVGSTTLTSSENQWKGITRLWSIDHSPSSTVDIPCLLASSSFGSKLLICKGNQLEDITLTTFDETHSESIYASTIYVKNIGLLLRVYPKGVSILMLQGNNTLIITSYKESDSEWYMEHATSWQDDQGTYVALCLAKNDLHVLKLLCIQDTSLEEYSDQISLSMSVANTVFLNECPSCIEHLYLNSVSFLFLGTYEASLLVYTVNKNIVSKAQGVIMNKFGTPHSLATIFSSRTYDKPLKLLVGTRWGFLLSFSILPSSQSIISDLPSRVWSIGDLPVRLSTSFYRLDIVYALSSHMCQVRSDSNESVDLERVLLPSFDRPVDAFSSFGCENSLQESIAIVADGKLHILLLDQEPGLNSSKTILGQTPRKTIYFRDKRCIAVFTSVVLSGTRKNYVRFIDALSGKFLTDFFSVGRDHPYAKNDTLLSAAEWSMECRGKKYQYICVGFGHSKQSFNAVRQSNPTGSSVALGMLVLYRLKFHPRRGPTLKCVWINEKLPGGVLSICPYSSKLLFSAKNRLYLYNFDPETGRLMEICCKSLPSDIISIQESNDRICIASQCNSIAFYQFIAETNNFELLKSDIGFMSAHHSLMLDSETSLCVTHSGGMIALKETDGHRFQKLFSFHHSEFMTCSVLALLGSHCKDENELLCKHILPWSIGLSESHKPIVACTVSGSILSTYRISENLYTTLKTLQELILDFEPTSPLLGSKQDFQLWYCQLSGADQAVIYGDLVEVYLRLSFKEQLQVLKPNGSLYIPLELAASSLLSKSDNYSPNNWGEESEESKTHIIANMLINLLSGLKKI